MLRPLHRLLCRLVDGWRTRRHAAVLTRKVAGRSNKKYRSYLDVQLRRTLSKRGTPLPGRARHFIDSIAERLTLPRCRVLCVGCRNTAEIDYFRSRGAAEVIGVDLYTEHPDIQVMDMHDLKFEKDRFDLLYSSHSLEHALDPAKAVSEFIRVVRPGGWIAIEVPVAFEPRGSDLFDFKSLENLHALFGEHLEAAVWSERSEPGSDTGEVGTAVVRTLMKMRKPDSSD